MATSPLQVESGKLGAAGEPAASVLVSQARPGARELRYSYYIVVLFAVSYMLSFMDRTMISLLVTPIKAEFDLTDTQVGMLVGFGFVLLYAVLGIPFGALADRSNRRNLILVGLIGWSFATSASAFAGSVGMLVILRTCVGIGEATLSPAAYSTIADRFPPERLGLALGIYAAGVGVGAGSAMIFGGLLVQFAEHVSIHVPLLGVLNGWRLALFGVGLLGFPLAALMLVTVREAPRHAHAAPPSLGDMLHYVAKRRLGLIGTLAAFSLVIMANYVILLWAPTLFMRVHGLTAQKTGLMLGAIVGICGPSGVLLSGALTDFLARRGKRSAALSVIFWAVIGQIPLMPLAFLVTSPSLSFLLFIPVMVLTSSSASLQGTALQLMVPPRMRGRIIAIYMLCITLVGMGVGPLIIGALSDHVFVNRTGLAPSMAAVAAVSLILGALILRLTRGAALAMELERLQEGRSP